MKSNILIMQFISTATSKLINFGVLKHIHMYARICIRISHLFVGQMFFLRTVLPLRL